MLQSTLNQQQGIGVACQAIIHAVFCISALLLPKYVIKNLGCKRALLLAVACHIPYIAANFYLNWFIMVPSAILRGICAPILWSSQCTYLNESSVIYTNLCLSKSHTQQKLTMDDSVVENNTGETIEGAVENNRFYAADTKRGRCQDLDISDDSSYQKEAGNQLNTFISNTEGERQKTNENICGNKSFFVTSKPEDALFSGNENLSDVLTSDSTVYSKLISSSAARFFGFFGLMYRSSDIWGNLMTYYVLNGNNVLDNITENDTCKCGALFCNVKSECFSHNLAEPNQYMRNMLTGLSVLLVLVSVALVFFFLDELEGSKRRMKFSFDLAMATSKCMGKKEVLLLLPLSIFDGLQQGFYIGDFTKSYIACAWGVYHVGLVTACYGIGTGIFSLFAGLLVKYTGRIPVILTGAAINTTMCIYLLIWNPLPDQPYIFFICAFMWGASVGILWFQQTAFFGVIFKEDEEAAFSAFYLWNSVGFCAAFSYSNYFCTYIKLYILLAVSTVGVIGYLYTEFIYNQKIRESQSK